MKTSRLLAMILLAGCSGFYGTPERPERHGFPQPTEPFPLEDIGTGIDLFAHVGQIQVLATTDRAVLEKTIIVSARSREEAAALASRCEVSILPGEDGRTHISFQPPPDLPTEGIGADTHLHIPSGLDLHLRTAAGLIDTSGYEARRATLESQEGSLRIGSTQEELHFKTRTGRIEIEESFKVATGTSESGGLLVREPPPGSRLTFDTKSGSCTILATVALEVCFVTLQGQLSCDVPGTERVTTPNGASHSQKYELKVPGAGPACTVRVVSEGGDLVIRQARQR